MLYLIYFLFSYVLCWRWWQMCQTSRRRHILLVWWTWRIKTHLYLKKVFYFGIGQSGKCHVNNVHQICVRKNQAHKCLLSFFWLFPAPFYVNLSFSHRKERRCCAWIWTWGCRMVGADGSTELWWRPSCLFTRGAL